MKIINLVFLMLTSALLSSCVTPLTIPLPSPAQREQARKNFEANNCNYEGAYQYGVKDANENRAMNSQWLASYCPMASRTEVMKGYRVGYESISRPPSSSVIIINK